MSHHQPLTPHPVDPKSDKSPPEKNDQTPSWKVLAPLLGAATVYFAYLVGVTFHQTHLEKFGIDPGAFPQGHSDYMIFAAMAALTDLHIIFLSILNLKTISTVFGTLLVAGAVSWLLVKGLIWLRERNRNRTRPPMSPEKKLLIAYFLGIPFGGTYLIFAIPIVFAMVMILPIQLGVAAANAMAKDEITDYAKGCSVHSHGREVASCLRTVF